MQKKEKLLNALFSTETQTILNTLETISKKGSSIFTIPMIEILSKTKNSEVQSKILHIFHHLKNQKAGEILAENISDKKYESLRKELISACWMNGLDYSEHLDIFLNIFAEEDFEIAFEAYTLITNSVTDKLHKDKMTALKEKSELIYNSSSDLKKEIAADLCEFFE